ncbi:YciI family protein [Amycolatopsis jejuensis]|uniref:YciI family protein n=1 Tax=Amycolatopsis jejuensis TaxID=330084 RepID=UPI0005247E1B|nr:YciI family protein [Amycolatopsis jejuensis]
MKYLLTLHMDPVVWDTLADDDKNAVYAGHGTFIETITASGEMVETKALAEPGDCVTVRVRNQDVQRETGLVGGAPAFLCGYYVVDVQSQERAVELAALIPDARHSAVEVRRVLHEA